MVYLLDWLDFELGRDSCAAQHRRDRRLPTTRSHWRCESLIGSVFFPSPCTEEYEKLRSAVAIDLTQLSGHAHKSSKQEIANLLGIVARNLKDSQAKDVSGDWRFAIAYNAL